MCMSNKQDILFLLNRVEENLLQQESNDNRLKTLLQTKETKREEAEASTASSSGNRNYRRGIFSIFRHRKGSK